MMGEHRVSYTLDSTLDTVNSAEEAASQIATEAGFGDEEVMKIAMAVREAAVNAVLHATRTTRARRSWSTLSELPASGHHHSDQGKGLDLNKVPDPLAPENLLKTSVVAFFSSARSWMRWKYARRNRHRD